MTTGSLSEGLHYSARVGDVALQLLNEVCRRVERVK